MYFYFITFVVFLPIDFKIVTDVPTTDVMILAMDWEGDKKN